MLTEIFVSLVFCVTYNKIVYFIANCETVPDTDSVRYVDYDL